MQNSTSFDILAKERGFFLSFYRFAQEMEETERGKKLQQVNVKSKTESKRRKEGERNCVFVDRGCQWLQLSARIPFRRRRTDCNESAPLLACVACMPMPLASASVSVYTVGQAVYSNLCE